MVGGGRVGEKRSMAETIIRRNKNWIGHNYYNERGWANERSYRYEKVNGGKERTR